MTARDDFAAAAEFARAVLRDLESLERNGPLPIAIDPTAARPSVAPRPLRPDDRLRDLIAGQYLSAGTWWASVPMGACTAWGRRR